MAWQFEIVSVDQQDYTGTTGTDELAARATIRIKADSQFDTTLLGPAALIYYSLNFDSNDWTDDFNIQIIPGGRNPFGFPIFGLTAGAHQNWVEYDATFKIPYAIYGTDDRIRFTGKLRSGPIQIFTTNDGATPSGSNTTTYLSYDERKYNRTRLLVNKIENIDGITGSIQSLNPIIYSSDSDHLKDAVIYVQQIYTEGDGVYATTGAPVDWLIQKNSSLGYCVGTDASCTDYTAWSWAKISENNGQQYGWWHQQGTDGFPIKLVDLISTPTGNQNPGQQINSTCNKLFLSIGSNQLPTGQVFYPLADDGVPILRWEYEMSAYAVALSTTDNPVIVNRLEDDDSVDAVLFNIELPPIPNFPEGGDDDFNSYGNVRAQGVHVFDPNWLDDDTQWLNASFDVLAETGGTIGSTVGSFMPVLATYGFDNITFDHNGNQIANEGPSSNFWYA